MIPVLTQSGVIDEKGFILGVRMKVGQRDDSSRLGRYKEDYVRWPGNVFFHCHSFAQHRGELFHDGSQNLLVCSDDSDPIDLTCGNEEVKLEPGDTYSGRVSWSNGCVPTRRGILMKKSGTVHKGRFITKAKG